jgi:HK97 family phage prohead protease
MYKGSRRVRGYASRFYDGSEGTEFLLLPGVKERIDPHAFDAALARGDDVALLYQHNEDLGVLARTGGDPGTLNLGADSIGLMFDTVLPDNGLGDSTLISMARGDLYSCSFCFSIDGPDGEDWFEEGDYAIRMIRSVRLVDCSIVLHPAYASASCEIVRGKDPPVGGTGGGGSGMGPGRSSRWTRQRVIDRANQISRDLIFSQARRVSVQTGLHFKH